MELYQLGQSWQLDCRLFIFFFFNEEELHYRKTPCFEPLQVYYLRAGTEGWRSFSPNAVIYGRHTPEGATFGRGRNGGWAGLGWGA